MERTDAVREVSRGLLGSRYRLEVAGFVAAHDWDLFFPRQVAEALRASGLGVADNKVGDELRRLRDVGLMTSLGRTAGNSRLYYQRVDSPVWSALGALSDAVCDMCDANAAGDATPAS
jgi:hypothetical protein